MNRRVHFLIILGMLILSSACTQVEIETLIGDSITTEIEQPASDEIQLQQEGIGPIEITPLPPGDEPNLAPSTDGDGGNINSRGERTTSESSNGEPGMIESKAPSGQTLEKDASLAVNWLTYQDPTYQFSIDYPDAYIILPEEDLPPGSDSGPLKKVRFLDRELAGGATADLEIPNFMIEVYDLGSLSLENYLELNLERGEREAINIGSLSGYRVYLNQMIAPSEFYYFADHGHVYKLTPMGKYSQEMLESFQIR